MTPDTGCQANRTCRWTYPTSTDTVGPHVGATWMPFPASGSGSALPTAVCYPSRAAIHALFLTQLLCTATEYTVACDRMEHVSGAALEAAYGERA